MKRNKTKTKTKEQKTKHKKKNVSSATITKLLRLKKTDIFTLRIIEK